MNITIKRLTPDLAEDYVHFFDETPHDQYVDEHKCYCVCWCNDDYEGKDFSSAAKRRMTAFQYVKNDNIHGYLAYHDGKVVGWCNANTKSECLKCASWRRSMDYVPLDDIVSGVKVKSVFCFTIAPDMQRKGIATILLERVCEDAAKDGFVFVEAYPAYAHGWQSSDFGGHVNMFERSGFVVISEPKQGLVMRKTLE